VSVLNETFFNEFTIRTPRDAKGLIEDLARRGVIGGLPVSRLAPGGELDDLVVVAATELDTAADRAAYSAALAQCL
jgi:glycine dehydrogenase subunit 1